ncbi:uncharacterized protein LOC141660725 [Apium graveolens]|uniref:uncharacterized protein LOC141660725 n=1 Tax=Apium graveolens TaxID=4045 RepID=UPI003D7A4BA8
MVGRGSGKRLALVADEAVDNSSSDDDFHLHDDDGDEDSSGSDEGGAYSPNDMYFDEDLDQGELSEGKCYRDKATLLLAVKRAHIATDRTYKMTKSNKEQLIIQCWAEGCNWRMRAAFMHNSDYWRINVNREEHRCLVDQPLQDHKKLSARMISQLVKPLVIDTPEIPIKTIIPLINNEHNHIVGYKKAWRGKQIAIEEVYGSWPTTYQDLPMFLTAIKKTNAGTIAEIDAVPHAQERGTSVCKRIFWCLKAMMDGWQHARPVISIDGTFLKGRYRGKLLIVMGVDSNNHPFPLCYGLVDEETYENWYWFLQRIRRHVCHQRPACASSLIEQPVFFLR